jgi:hypothetical protein
MLTVTNGVMDYTKHVLSLYSCLVDLVTHSKADAAACLQPAPAALQLILTAYETLLPVQRQVQLLQAHSQEHAQPQQQQQRTAGSSEVLAGPEFATFISSLQAHLLCAAHTLFKTLTDFITASLSDGSDEQGQSAQGSTLYELLCSPQLHRCLTLVTAVTVLGYVGWARRRSDGYGNSSGSSDGNGGSSGGSGNIISSSNSGGGGLAEYLQASDHKAAAAIVADQAAAAAASAAQSRSRLASVGGPSSSRLFELLGVDPAAVHFAASWTQLVDLSVEPIRDMFSILLSPQVHPMTERLRRLEATFLLGMLLLHAADSLPRWQHAARSPVAEGICFLCAVVFSRHSRTRRGTC